MNHTSSGNDQMPFALDTVNLQRITEYYKVSHKTLIVVSVFTCIFGTLFNLINFVVFYRMKKRNTQNIYLIALSLADIYNIQMNILIPMLRTLWIKFDNMFYETHMCKVNGYLVEIGLLMPVWIMVLLAAERFYCIMCPLKNVTSSPRNAKLILSLLLCVVMGWSMFKFKTAGVEERSIFKLLLTPQEDKSSDCQITHTTIVNISTLMWALVPGIASLVLNLCIIRKIRKSTSPNKVFYHQKQNRIKKVTQTTRVVLSLSFIFIITLAPTGILVICSMFDIFNENFALYLILHIARKYTLILYEINMIISFPIYLYTIKTFR